MQSAIILNFIIFLIVSAVDDILAYRSPISCYHCASLEYKPLFRRFEHLNSAYRSSMNFGNFCDFSHSIQQSSPAASCEYSCITIFEPQYFGGLINPQKPYAFIRGCATDIFSFNPRRPAEVDFLHRGEICISIPLSQIWQDSISNDLVHVCSCTSNGCNFHDAISFSPSNHQHSLPLCLLFISVIITKFLL
uniref:Uncharacterized protein n=1 Tax=Panagrolaimus sp. PS1159 TaxID=55785 RepID=A0AC35GWA0_9BILA